MTKVVAETAKNDIAAFNPAMMEMDAGAGMDNMGTEDLALPFLKILSGLDPVLDENEEARKGDIYNTVTSTPYKGKVGVRVVPCAYQRRFIQWSPRGSGNGAPIGIFDPSQERPKTERSPDDNKEYVVGGDGSYIEETHQHFVLLLKEDGTMETALIAMKSTQLKKSRKWNSMMASRTVKGKNGSFTPPRYSHIYHLKTVSEENSKGSWHGWEMSCEGVIQDGDLYARAKAFAESITAGEVVVKHTDDDEKGDKTPF
jgi:hypothetical protein